MSTLTTSIHEMLSHGNQKKKKKKERKEKGNPVGKEVKSSLFADDVMLYIENPKDATRKLIELINEFGKLQYTKLVHIDLSQFL